MKLRLVEGGAGSGKTELCLSEIAARLQAEPLGAPLLLLVPEQATFVAERALTGYPGVGATLRAEVLGFSGLYRWLAGEADYPALPWLDEQGRSMLLLACVQDSIGELELLKPSAKNAGFMDLLARTLVEFEQYRITPEMLFEARSELGDGDGMLAAKLGDLAVIYRAYLARIEGGFRDRGVMMRELCQAAANSRRLAGAEIWLDGFMDMNLSQMAVLREIFAKAKTVTVTLNLPDLGAARIFGGQRRLRAQFMQIARELGAEVEVVRLTANHRHRDNAELAAVEVCYASGDFVAATDEIPGHIHLLAAENPQEEAERAAELIYRLCSEKSYKFRDIAVITRKIGDYRNALENAFRDFDIPYFFDMGRDVSHHPLVKLVAEVLAVLYDNWGTPSVLAYLKSGLADITNEEADILENYALRVGLRGTMWRQAGNFRRGRADELAQINEPAARALAPLLKLAEKLKDATLVGEYAAAMSEFLAEIKAAEQMQAWAQNALQSGDLLQAEAHRQIFDKVSLLLDELADFLGDMPSDARRFAEFWREGAARLALSSIPPSANQVNVADISRSRLSEVKAAIVLGVSEGTLPAVAEDSGLLASQDKERLAGLGLELPPGGRERQFAEDYLLYLALTRSSEELYLTYSRTAADGSEKNPSPALSDMQRIFPALVEEKYTPRYALGGDRVLLKGLSRHLANCKAGEADMADDAFWREVCHRLQEEGRLTAELRLLAEGLGYRVNSQPLDSRRLAALYPNQSYTSVSRMERFNNCPCQYFAQYGLRLAPRDEFKLRTMDVGTLYHYVLAEVIAKLAAADCDWQNLQEADVLPLIEAAMREFAENGLAEIFADSGRNTYAAEKMRAVLTQTLLDMAKNLAAGSFKPTELELSFGRGGDGALKPLYITTESGRKIKLVGQIDRVDRAVGADGEYMRIIDYKMSNKTLKMSDIYYGLNWQMPLYLRALLDNARTAGEKATDKMGDKLPKPAGMFYVPVQEIIKSVKAADEDGAAVKLQGLAILDMEALVLAERDLVPGAYAKTMQVHIKKDNSYGATTLGMSPAEYDFMQACLGREAGATLGAMLSGEVSQRPVLQNGRMACEYCDFYALCALDLAVEPKAREVLPLSGAQVIERLCEKYPDLAQKFGVGSEVE